MHDYSGGTEMLSLRTPVLKLVMGFAAAAATIGVSVASGEAATASSASYAAPPKSCGQVFITGTKWLGGHGVNVRSNGAAEGTGGDCSSATSYFNGVVAGRSWQCAELVNRLYLYRGWITTTWNGNAGIEMWNNTPAKLSKQSDGSVSYLGPGDVVDINEYYKGKLIGGHVFVVNAAKRVTSGTVGLVSQNNMSVPQKPGSLKAGTVTVSGAGGGWTYKVIGVIHAP